MRATASLPRQRSRRAAGSRRGCPLVPASPLSRETAPHMWSNLAGAQGDEDARRLRVEIAKDMTATQVAEAQRGAGERNGLGGR